MDWKFDWDLAVDSLRAIIEGVLDDFVGWGGFEKEGLAEAWRAVDEFYYDVVCGAHREEGLGVAGVEDADKQLLGVEDRVAGCLGAGKASVETVRHGGVAEAEALWKVSICFFCVLPMLLCLIRLLFWLYLLCLPCLPCLLCLLYSLCPLARHILKNEGIKRGTLPSRPCASNFRQLFRFLALRRILLASLVVLLLMGCHTWTSRNIEERKS